MNPWLLLVVGVVLGAQGTWMFIDARKRGDHYWLWGIFGLIQFPSCLLVYLLITRNQKMICPDCGRSFKKKESTCPHCGGATQVCPRCSEEVQIGWAYCPQCSYRLKND